MNRAQLTRVSGNTKTGPIAVSGTDRASCPRACSFRNNGCYANQHHLGSHWNKVSDGSRGSEWLDFIKQVKTLPAQVWRHNQFGDLPGIEDRIDSESLYQLVRANAHAKAKGFTYTHKPTNRVAVERMNASRIKDGLAPLSPAESQTLVRQNRAAVAAANAAGFTINVSCDSLAEVDAAASFAWPTVVVLPIGAPVVSYTPQGRKVVKCPAQVAKTKVDCLKCGNGRPLCQRTDRQITIGFEAHGAQRGRVSLAVVR